MIRPVSKDGRIETGGAFTPILRRRVVDRIASAAAQRVVLIVAPAGYGKSVALRQYLATLGPLPHLRYDVRAENATLLGFLRGFADALLEIAPGARKTVSGAYERSRSSKTPGLDLAIWMHAHIKTYTGVIAIDDLHVVENDPEVSKFLVSLIERTKGRSSWIIASRSSLDLPVGSWLAYGEMDLNIDEQDLRFTIEEAREAAKASRVGVRDEELGEILSMTEGWPTALSFALRTSTRSVDLRNIAATTREMVYRYLAEQVYRSLEDDERELLHFIGFLPEIDLEVLRAAGYPKGKALIEALRDRVSFIYPERPGVYRCHDLFRDFLRHQLELEGTNAADAMQRRVARALEESGNIAGAVSLYAGARCERDVLRLLPLGFDLLDQAHADVVARALDSLSQDIRATNPLVLGLRGVAAAAAGRFDRAESLLARALQRSGDEKLSAALALRLGLILFNQNRQVFDLLEPLAGNELAPLEARAQALSLLAPSYAIAGRRADAGRAMRRAEEFLNLLDSDEVRAKVLYRMGVAAITLAGDRAVVETYFSQAHALASRGLLFVTAAAALGGLAGLALFYDDDLAKYAWYAQQALVAAVKAGDRFSMQTSLLHLIHAETLRGNPERLTTLDQQLANVTTSDSTRLSYIVLTRAMLAAWDGRFAEAYRLLSTHHGFYDFDRLFNASVQALCAVSSGQRDIAVAMVSSIISELHGKDFEYLYGRRIAEVACLLCAAVESFAGRATSANRILRREGAGGPAVDGTREVVLALCRAIKSPVLRSDVDEAISRLRLTGYGGIARLLERATDRYFEEQTVTDIALTPAEVNVLRALAQGRSPKDIALESGRSIFTVQVHIKNLIKKLGCSGRNEALVAARKRGLLA
jgi:ATP/maltotriose-dependent transcriptional regulator MalT